MALLTFKLADADGNFVGSLDRATNPVVGNALKGAATIAGTIRTDTYPHAGSLLEQRSRVLAYLDDVLIANTWLVSCKDSGARASSSSDFACADPLGARVARRVRKNEAAYGRTPDADYRVWSGVDLGEWVMQVIDDENLRGYTGLRTRAESYLIGVLRSITLEQDKPTMEAIAENANAIDGYDYGVLPIDTGGYMGDIAVWTKRGTTRDNVKYEFGTGKGNIESFTVDNDAARLTTNQLMLGGGGERVEVENVDAVTAYGTRLDSVDTYSDLTDPVLLGVLGEQIADWRSRPKQTLTFVPAATSRYLPTRDFDIGDMITVNITGGRLVGDNAISGLVRVYGYTLGRGEGGLARCTSITISPTDQGGIT